jgi:lipopolysaccharide/colanic/teichoic acid biosynthesis glycosyltransferase
MWIARLDRVDASFDVLGDRDVRNADEVSGQVTMTTKVKPSQVSREAVALTATVRNGAPAPRAKSAQVVPLKPHNYSSAKSQNDALFAPASKARTTGLVYEAAKRVFDFVLGLILLIIATPIILLAAAAIRFETKGSPFFIQTRLGKGGKPFKIVKLRGMFIDARIRFASYYDYSGHRDLEFCFHHEDDPRVTRAGRFIRKTSIDELPNLWNVLIGDMSLVGPRPEIPEVLALYGPYREEYLSVKPGVTCLSKCTGRDRLTKKETIEFDLGYIRDRSFGLDFKILWKTFRGVVLRRDVF